MRTSSLLLAVPILGLVPAAQAQTYVTKVQDQLSLPNLGTPTISAEVMSSDQRGLRSVGQSRIDITPQTTVEVLSSDSVVRAFGRDSLGRTLESGLELKLESRDHRRNHWLVRIRSQSTRQDVSHFNEVIEEEQYKHQTYSIAQGWRRELFRNLDVEVLFGGARCMDADENEARYFPLGGITLRRHAAWGSVSAALKQEVEGSGSISGLYGSQLERGVGFELKVNLSPQLRFLTDCSLLAAFGAFQEKDLLRKTPVMTGGVALEYQLVDVLSASVRYAHRWNLHSTHDLAHAGSGPLGMAAFTYRFN